MEKGLRLMVAGAVLAGLAALPGLAAGPAQPVLSILRPTRSEPDLRLVAEKETARGRVFYPHAAIHVAGPAGLSKTLAADLTGVARLSPIELLKGMPPNAATLTLSAKVSLGERQTAKSLSFTPAELRLAVKEASEGWVDRGNQHAQAGRLEKAIYYYEQALELNPLSKRATHNLALAYEKLGWLHLAGAKYSDYLSQRAMQGADRLAAKKKAIQLAKAAKRAPLIPAKALDLLQAGAEQAQKDKWPSALFLYEAAQSLAPAWPEPYYAAGLAMEFLNYQQEGRLTANAVQYYRLFLLASASGDSRRPEIVSRIETLEKMEAGLQAPAMVRE